MAEGGCPKPAPTQGRRPAGCQPPATSQRNQEFQAGHAEGCVGAKPKPHGGASRELRPGPPRRSGRDPPAPLTCSAMIPKSPKQACCTKFRLSTRTQPAGRESGEAQGCRPRRGHATHLASLPGLLVQQRPGGPPREMSACRRTAHGHRPRTHIGCTVKRIPGYRERARSQSAATRGARTG